MSLGSIFLRFGGIILRAFQFIFAFICMGVFAYFVSNLNDGVSRVATTWQAVLGISIAAAIYTVFGVLFTLCFGGNSLLGNLAVFLDVAFIGAFIYVAWATRGATYGCDASGAVYTPLGSGYAGTGTGLNVASSLRRACQLNVLVFASAIILCVLFFLSAIWQSMMVRRSQRTSRQSRLSSKV